MTFGQILCIVFGLSFLVIVHESGHYFAARAYGMRVLRFSIGLGPAIVRWQPKGSPTVFQIAASPVLAYVQIDGMNPAEEIDKNDPALFPNKSLMARAVTLLAGPLANYAAAALLFFGLFAIGGLPRTASRGPIRVGSVATGCDPVSIGSAAVNALLYPALLTAAQFQALAQLVVAPSLGMLQGPVAMGQQMAESFEAGWYHYVGLVAAISVALAVFNLLPFPALDGGRLVFVVFELIARRRPNERVEAITHTVGILFLLGLSVIVAIREAFAG
jgi:membrane-associated protease RseP (regulator of RpoE activity)